MEKKLLFKDYEEWCVKENKDPLNENSVAEFKKFKEEQEQAEQEKTKDAEKAQNAEKQKEIFKMMCEYVGVKAKYEQEYMYRELDAMFKSAVLAAVMVQEEQKVTEIIDKVLD